MREGCTAPVIPNGNDLVDAVAACRWLGLFVCLFVWSFRHANFYYCDESESLQRHICAAYKDLEAALLQGETATHLRWMLHKLTSTGIVWFKRRDLPRTWFSLHRGASNHNVVAFMMSQLRFTAAHCLALQWIHSFYRIKYSLLVGSSPQSTHGFGNITYRITCETEIIPF